MARPVIYVLAGVNGAGKSSVGGYLLTQAGMSWFNPDTYARELAAAYGQSQQEANITAWNEGVRRLDLAIASAASFAFETTLGGDTIAARLMAAAATHDVLMWYCSLSSAEQHIARVRLRVTQGGHDIPQDRIRARWSSSMRNLLALMPYLAQLQVYDNSVDVAVGEPVPDPVLVMASEDQQLIYPASLEEARHTPDWAKPLLEAAWQDAGR